MTASATARPAADVPVSRESGLRALSAIRHEPLELITRTREEHGLIARLRVPGLPMYLVSDPTAIQDALIRTHHGYVKGRRRRGGDPGGPGIEPLRRALGDGLLSSPPELHKRQRRLMQPMFHRERIAEYAATFAGLAAELADQWRPGERRDMHRDMTELTLAIVARTIFDVDLDDTVVTTIRDAMSVNQRTLRRAALPGGTLLDRLPLPSTRRWHESRAALDAVVYRLIDERRAAGTTGRDLLSLLLSVRDADTGEAMPDRQVRDEAMTLLLAGHETTANALSWMLHLLGRHPDEQARLHSELDEVLGSRLPTADDFGRLPYATAVLHETMRLFPPAWLLLRRLAEDRDVCGYHLPVGSVLMLAPWVVHRDPLWWPEASRFLPERWLAPNGDRPRFAYFPFGGGPRQCIGNTFAEMEAVLVIATLLRRWRVAPASDEPVRPLPLVTLRPRGGIDMTVHAR
jgi:cytochrome P450